MSGGILKKIRSGAIASIIGIGAFSAVNIYYDKQKFYDQILIPTIQYLDPELSHKLTILWFKSGLVPKSQYKDTPILVNKIKHLSFRNPLGIAAGFDKNGEAVSSLENIGFGFVEVGTVTPKAQTGNDKPRVFRLLEDKAIINRYGLNNDGYEIVHTRLQKLKQNKSFNGILGINLGPNETSENTISDYVNGITVFSDVADYFAINVSCPNTSNLKNLKKKENLKNLLTAVISARNNLTIEPKPLIFLKLSPDLTKEEKNDIIKILKDKMCQIDGLIISNTTVERSLNLKSSSASEPGGLSGLPLKEHSTKLIAEMFKLTKGSIPIIGVGGVFTGQDAYEKVKAGASLIQLYTSFTFHGPPLIANIKKELQSLVNDDNYGNIAEAVGKDSKK
ncbi:hypothetical protein PGB90_003341 [Kerria lacca]